MVEEDLLFVALMNEQPAQGLLDITKSNAFVNNAEREESARAPEPRQ